jgi:hypothetical protein
MSQNYSSASISKIRFILNACMSVAFFTIGSTAWTKDAPKGGPYTVPRSICMAGDKACLEKWKCDPVTGVCVFTEDEIMVPAASIVNDAGGSSGGGSSGGGSSSGGSSSGGSSSGGSSSGGSSSGGSSSGGSSSGGTDPKTDVGNPGWGDGEGGGKDKPKKN